MIEVAPNESNRPITCFFDAATHVPPKRMLVLGYEFAKGSKELQMIPDANYRNGKWFFWTHDDEGSPLELEFQPVKWCFYPFPE